MSVIDTVYQLDIPVSLALLGDLHGRPYQEVLDSLRNRKPGIIAIAGDILYGAYPSDNISPLMTQPCVLPFLEACCSVAPTFLSFGNHEWMLDGEDIKKIQSTGVEVLDNCWIEHEGLVIGGLTSAYATEYRRYRESHDQAESRYPKMMRHEGNDRVSDC